MSETKQKVSAAPAEESAIKFDGVFHEPHEKSPYTSPRGVFHYHSRIKVEIPCEQLDNMIRYLRRYCCSETENYDVLENAVKIARELNVAKNKAWMEFHKQAQSQVLTRR